MVEIEQDWDEIDFEDWRLREDEDALSPAGIAEQNDGLLRRYREFRCAADAVVAAWRNHPEVVAAALVGSLAVAPWKEVPRFAPYPRAQIALWHECKEGHLAVCLAHRTSAASRSPWRQTASSSRSTARPAGSPALPSCRCQPAKTRPTVWRPRDRYGLWEIQPGGARPCKNIGETVLAAPGSILARSPLLGLTFAVIYNCLLNLSGHFCQLPAT